MCGVGSRSRVLVFLASQHKAAGFFCVSGAGEMEGGCRSGEGPVFESLAHLVRGVACNPGCISACDLLFITRVRDRGVDCVQQSTKIPKTLSGQQNFSGTF